MTTWRLFTVALLLPVLFTAAVMVNVQRNRSSARAPMELTQRELSLSGGDDDNAGMTAWLMWSYESDLDPSWLTADKLRALGFDDQRPSAARDGGNVSRQLQRRIYLVMALTDQSGPRSRLVPIDAGLDLDALRERYPDGRIHLITAAVVGMRSRLRAGEAVSEGAYLVSVEPRRIYVPAEFTAELRRRNRARTPFTIAVRYGSRLEPWVVGVR